MAMDSGSLWGTGRHTWGGSVRTFSGLRPCGPPQAPDKYSSMSLSRLTRTPADPAHPHLCHRCSLGV